MLIAAFAMVSALTLSSAGAPKPAHPAKVGQNREGPSRPGRLGTLSPGDLYSARAKRRMASFLRMRLLELRLRSLDRAADVVEHRLSLDALLRSP